MSKMNLKKAPLAAAVSLALGSGALPAAVLAQQATGDAIEEVVVTGIRQSLKRSMDLKRNSDGIVDAISAEDIGDFPDSNLAESLQRVTGVSIDRQRGEGARVTVRGFGPSFNLVTLNGRQMPTSAIDSGNITGRSFDFANLASENIAAVEIHKSGQANVPSGGIGSTINIRTTRPLDAPGLVATIGGSLVADQSTEEGDDWTPQLSGLFSATFADDTIGIAISGSYQERHNGLDQAAIGAWHTYDAGDPILANDAMQVNAPSGDDIFSLPQNIAYRFHEYEQTRLNGQVTLQWQPSDRIQATLDHTLADFDIQREWHDYSAWYSHGVEESVWRDGPIATPISYTQLHYFPNDPDPQKRGGLADVAMGGGLDASANKLTSTGLNLLWDFSDNLKFELDFHDSSAESEPDSPWGHAANISTASFTRDRTIGHFGAGRIPILQLQLDRPLSPDDMQVTGSVFDWAIAKMDIQQTELSGSYEFDTGFVKSIDFGVEITDLDYRSASSSVGRHDGWGGVPATLGNIADLAIPASIGDAFDEFPGSDDPRLHRDYYRFDIEALIARATPLLGGGDDPCSVRLCPTQDFSTDRRTSEESLSVYAQAKLEWDLMWWPAELRAGLRYEQTDVTSAALAADYTRIDWGSANELALIEGGSDFFTYEGDYSAVLPNLDLKVDFSDNLVGRLSLSKTLTRPNFSDIQGGQTIDSLVRVHGGTGQRGDPGLKPFDSENIDVSVEYYYSDDSYVSAGYFHKSVDNFIGTSVIRETTFNLPHPANGPLYAAAVAALGPNADPGSIRQWILDNRPNADGVDTVNGIVSGVEGDGFAVFELTVPVNIREATIDGWEVALQHNFGESGFGVIANATVVDGDVGYNNNSLEDQFVLNGLSDSANLVAFYDKNGLGVRLAYNWRDEFLAGIGQPNSPSNPTHVDSYQQWDLNVSYNFLESYHVSLDVINITNEARYLYGRNKHQTLFAEQTGPRYVLSFRYKL